MKHLVAAAVVLASGAAMAAPIAGNSNGSYFSNLSPTGSGSYTQYYTASGNSNSGIQWGDSNGSGGLTDPSSLAAANVTWSGNTPTNDTVIAQLVWFNSDTQDNRTPDNMSVVYNVALDFSTPDASAFSHTFAIAITNTTNPQGDIADLAVGANLTALMGTINANLNPLGYAVTELKFVLGSSVGDTYDAATGVWRNKEDRTSTLNLVADFTTLTPTLVPEPATLSLLGAGLIGLGFASRRRRA